MRQLSIIFFILVLLTSCAEQTASLSHKDPITLAYAENFRIDSLAIGIQLSIGEKGGRQWHFILSKDKPTQLPPGCTWIKTPVQRMLTLAGTDIGMLSLLHQEDRICGVADRRTVYNSKVLARIASEKIIDFGNQDQLSVERILLSKAQLISYSSFGKDFPHEKELALAGIVCIPILDWKEQHPLGKAEWLKVYGYLLGKERNAIALFNQTAENYNRLKAASKKNKLKTNVFSGNQTGEIWFCPAGDSYEAQLIADAGGNYTYKNTRGTGSLSLTPEKVFTDNRQSNIWINPEAASYSELKQKQPKAIHFNAFSAKKVYCYSSNMNKYWETAACQPDKVLSDLLTIFENKDPKGLHFYAPLR